MGEVAAVAVMAVVAAAVAAEDISSGKTKAAANLAKLWKASVRKYFEIFFSRPKFVFQIFLISAA